jgi:hypothetical protein
MAVAPTPIGDFEKRYHMRYQLVGSSGDAATVLM